MKLKIYFINHSIDFNNETEEDIERITVWYEHSSAKACIVINNKKRKIYIIKEKIQYLETVED